MAQRPRSRTLLAILTLVALVLITLDYREGESGALAAVRRGALIVFAPIQDGFSQVVQPIGGFFSSVTELASLRERNRELEEELEGLRADLPSVADLERENAELRGMLSMRDRFELETVAATVISRPPGERGHTVVLDAGGDDGIETGMAVLGARGLVGKITVTTPRYAWVEMLSSPTARYAVRVADTGERGMLRGQGADPFQMEMLDPEERVEPGLEVVTHHFQGSTIPDGLPVGEVTEAGVDGGGPSPRYHPVRPFVDFRRLSTVQVVLNAPEPPVDFDPGDVIEPPGDERPPATPDDDTDDGDDSDDDDGDGDSDGGDDSDDDSDDDVAAAE